MSFHFNRAALQYCTIYGVLVRIGARRFAFNVTVMRGAR